MNRSLLFVGIGGAALVARILAEGFAQEHKTPPFLRPVAVLFVVLHVLLPPFAFAGTIGGMALLGRVMERGVDGITLPEAAVDKTALVVNSPTYFITILLPLKHALDNKPLPAHYYTLSPNSIRPVPLRVTRLDERTLRYEPEGGYSDMVFRAAGEPFEAGEEVRLPGMTISIAEAAEGVATAVDFRFSVPLEDESLLWLQLKGLKGFAYEPFSPPPVGETVLLNE